MKRGDGQVSVYSQRRAKQAGVCGAARTSSLSAQQRRNVPSKCSWSLCCSQLLNIPQRSQVQPVSSPRAPLRAGSSPLVLSDKVSLSYSVPVLKPAGDSKIKPKTSPVYLPAVGCQHWSPDDDQDLPQLSCGIYQQLQKQFSSEWLLRAFICRDNQVKLCDRLCSAVYPSPPKGRVTLQQGRPSLPHNLCFCVLGLRSVLNQSPHLVLHV